MISITLITGIASLIGCLCMAAVCAAQLAQLFAAVRTEKPVQHSWEVAPVPYRRLTPSSLVCAV